jgi:hypothetical protein
MTTKMNHYNKKILTILQTMEEEEEEEESSLEGKIHSLRVDSLHLREVIRVMELVGVVRMELLHHRDQEEEEEEGEEGEGVQSLQLEGQEVH